MVRLSDVICAVYAEQAQVKASPEAMEFNCAQRSSSRVLLLHAMLTCLFP